MRHYLNTTLKGKKDELGLSYYSVYYMFSVNRQTFKVKSRILNRPYTIDHFNSIDQSNHLFIKKDEDIITFCISESMNHGILNIEQFKVLYAKNCTSIFKWLKEYVGNTPTRIMDDFIYGTDLQGDIENQLNIIENHHGIDRFAALSYLSLYYEYHLETISIQKHLLVFDWRFGLREEFADFLNRTGQVPSHHGNILKFIDNLISII